MYANHRADLRIHDLDWVELRTGLHPARTSHLPGRWHAAMRGAPVSVSPIWSTASSTIRSSAFPARAYSLNGFHPAIAQLKDGFEIQQRPHEAGGAANSTTPVQKFQRVYGKKHDPYAWRLSAPAARIPPWWLPASIARATVSTWKPIAIAVEFESTISIGASAGSIAFACTAELTVPDSLEEIRIDRIWIILIEQFLVDL